MKSRRQKRRERQERRYRQWFHQFEVEYFIRSEYPGCPEIAVVYFATRICTEPKNWRGMSMAAAVDVTMRNHLRHEFTDYDQMLMVGVRRKDARRRVQPKVDAMIASWKKSRFAKPVGEKMDPKALTEELLITDKIVMDYLAR